MAKALVDHRGRPLSPTVEDIVRTKRLLPQLNTGRGNPNWVKGMKNPNPNYRTAYQLPRLKPEDYFHAYSEAWPKVAQQRVAHAKRGCHKCMDRVEDRLFGKMTQPVAVENIRRHAERLATTLGVSLDELYERAGLAHLRLIEGEVIARDDEANGRR